MHFRPVRIFDYVTVGYDAIAVDEEPAAAREFLAARVKRFDRDGGRFNAADEFRKNILRWYDLEGDD